jgi:Putative adhesin
MKKAFLIVCATVLGLAALGGIAYGTNAALSTSKTTTTDISERVRAVVIDVDAGDVELVRGSDRVQVRETSEYLLTKPDVKRTVENGVLTLKSSCGPLFLLDCSTDLRVEVPQGVAVRASVDTGRVTGTDLASSDVRVNTDVGEVRLALSTTPDRVEAKSDVGDIELELPDAVYAVDADSDVGATDVHGIVQDDRSPRTITATSDVGDVSVTGRVH